MKTRPAAGLGTTIDEAMARVVEVGNRQELLALLQKEYGFWNPTDENVTIEKYGTGIDRRIGWDTHLICVDGKAALFSDGPLVGVPVLRWVPRLGLWDCTDGEIHGGGKTQDEALADFHQAKAEEFHDSTVGWSS